MQLTYFSVWPQAASSMDSNAPVVGADRETTVPKQPRTNRHLLPISWATPAGWPERRIEFAK